MEETKPQHIARPDWLKIKTPGGKNFAQVKSMLHTNCLHTVCEEAHCPNMAECWNSKTATFMILGNICTRNCRYCATRTGKPLPPNPLEPMHLAESVNKMGLRHAVITSVTRDDLKDCGAEFWAEVVRTCRKVNPDVTVEILVPDFKANADFCEIVFKERPDIFNHNIETVKALFPTARPQGNYDDSIKVLKAAKEFGLRTKTGFMVGLGETREQILELMNDMHNIGVSILTIGQYLQPTREHLPVARYVSPQEFDELKQIALEIGFDKVESGPLVRSSYHAAQHF